MPEFHAEPYIYLPAVTHKSVLIAWGAFYFRVTSRDRWKLVNDEDLRFVHPPRKDSIGACSAPYGPAHVEVYDRGGAMVARAQTEATNHCWVAGLAADTEYTYKVFVKVRGMGGGRALGLVGGGESARSGRRQVRQSLSHHPGSARRQRAR